MTIIEKLRAAMARIEAINTALNDPNGDGSGDGAQPPDGDSYNAVLDELTPLFGAADALETAIKALRVIYVGSSITGRWIDDGCEAIDGEEDDAPDGCYDRDKPPLGYDADGWCGDPDLKPAEPLMPVTWENYTGEEQDTWLYSCSEEAKRALEALGVPLTEGEG